MNKRYKVIVFGIIVIFFLLILITFLEKHSRSEIDLRGQPTLGDVRAPVHIIAFEDPFCPHCMRYNLDIFPLIKENYIDTGKIKYTLILVSFINNSEENALAALCVYYTYPPLFFPFVDEVFRKEEETQEFSPSLWEKVALSFDEIHLNTLQNCVKSGRFNKKLEQNLKLGQTLLGSNFGTPMLLINDTAVPGIDYEEIKTIIEKEWEKK